MRKEVKQLESKVINTSTKVNYLETQRVVRVPTGAPTRIDSREQVREFSAEDKLLKNGIESYKSGDARGSIENLLSFVRQYPQSNKVDQAIYYLSQTYYNERQYSQAKELLSPYLQQTSKNTSFIDKSRALLAKIYSATGESPAVRPSVILSEVEDTERTNLPDIILSTSEEDNLIDKKEITIDDFFKR